MRTVSNAEFRAYMASIVLPAGFTSTFVDNDWPQKELAEQPLDCIIQSESVKIIFRAAGHGSTSFKCPDGWRTFDRRGVDWSFYSQPLWDTDDRELDPTKILTEQIERVKKRVAYYETALKVPGLQGNFTVAPDQVKALQDQLKKTGCVMFTPAGFGTGYNVLKKRPKHNYGVRRAPTELEAFMNHAPLWVMSIDCD